MAAIIGDAHAADKGLTTPATHGQQVRGEQRRWANSDAGRTATLGEQQRNGLELAGRCPW
jgi:hypothetical protein